MRLACYLMLPLLVPKREEGVVTAVATEAAAASARQDARARDAAVPVQAAVVNARVLVAADARLRDEREAAALPAMPNPVIAPAASATPLKCPSPALRPRRLERAHRIAALRPARKRRRVQAR